MNTNLPLWKEVC